MISSNSTEMQKTHRQTKEDEWRKGKKEEKKNRRGTEGTAPPAKEKRTRCRAIGQPEEMEQQKDKGRKELLWPPVNPNDVQQDVTDKTSPEHRSGRGMKDRYRHQPIPKSPPSNRQTTKRTASRAALTNSAYAQHVRPGLRPEEQEEPRAPYSQPKEELATSRPSGTEQEKEEEPGRVQNGLRRHH